MKSSEIDFVRQEMFYCFATAAIFEHKFRRYGRKLRLLSFFGIATPLAVGSLVMSFGNSAAFIHIAMAIAGGLSTIQLILSVWAITFHWDQKFAYAAESHSDNSRLSHLFEELLKSNPQSQEAALRLSELKIQNDQRSNLDTKQEISDKAKRRGHRAALRHFQIECTDCKKVPTSMKPTSCSICGKF